MGQTSSCFRVTEGSEKMDTSESKSGDSELSLSEMECKFPKLPSKILKSANKFWIKAEKSISDYQKLQLNLLIYSILFQSVKQARKQMITIDITEAKFQNLFTNQISGILDTLMRCHNNESQLLAELSIYISLFQRYNIEPSALLSFWDRFTQELEQICGEHFTIRIRYCVDVCALYFFNIVSRSKPTIEPISDVQSSEQCQRRSLKIENLLYPNIGVLLYDLLHLTFLKSPIICLGHCFGKHYLAMFVRSRITDINICNFWFYYFQFTNVAMPIIDRYRCGLVLINQYLHPNDDNALLRKNITHQSTIDNVIIGWKAVCDRFQSQITIQNRRNNVVDTDSDGSDTNDRCYYTTVDTFEPIYNAVMQWLFNNHWKQLSNVFN